MLKKVSIEHGPQMQNKLCNKYKIMLDVYKFVSDNADGEAAGTWEENCHKGAALFMAELERRDGK